MFDRSVPDNSLPNEPLLPDTFVSVYGPVSSWRYGKSLGIDPIGPVSTCSFNCVYCQLGEIQDRTAERRVFVPTAKILKDLQAFAPWEVDAITFSGNGEPTLALNLGEAIVEVKRLTHKPVTVLTNATRLGDLDVRTALGEADRVAAKLDAVFPSELKRIDRPVFGLNWQGIWAGLQELRQDYRGILEIQTMLLTPWTDTQRVEYIRLMRELQPDAIQLNTPTRPKPVVPQLEARGNHSDAASRPYEVHQLKQVPTSVLAEIAKAVEAETGIPVRFTPARSDSATDR
ncbi:MAG: radical SAM protein [Cyanobacteria bacterium SID2]|nr:radical SAM protein [Cyanobacteria bacterium SID2]